MLAERLGIIEQWQAKPKKLNLTEDILTEYIRAAWEHLEREEGHEGRALVQESIEKIEVEGDQVSIDDTFAPSTSVVGFHWLPE